MQRLMGIQSLRWRHIPYVLSRACRQPPNDQWIGPPHLLTAACRSGHRGRNYAVRVHPYDTYRQTRSLECIPDRERIRRTSSSIPRLPRTFWPVTRCTDDCKWIPAASPDPPGIEAPLFFRGSENKKNGRKWTTGESLRNCKSFDKSLTSRNRGKSHAPKHTYGKQWTKWTKKK
jgi:hypothetical protein